MVKSFKLSCSTRICPPCSRSLFPTVLRQRAGARSSAKPGFNSGNRLRCKSRLLLHLPWAQVGKTECLDVQKYQNVHPHDCVSDLQAAGRKLSRKPTANIPGNRVSLHLQIFDFRGEAWITKLHLLDSKALAQQLCVPSPWRAHCIQPQKRGSISSSQRSHSIFYPQAGDSSSGAGKPFPLWIHLFVLLQVLPYLAFSFLGLGRQEMRFFSHHHSYHVLVPGRNSCDLHSAGKGFWGVLHHKSLACSGKRQVFLLCLHQYLNTSAHPADSLMVKVRLDTFLPWAGFHLLKSPASGTFTDAAGRSCHQPHCASRNNKGTQMQRARPQNLWHSPEIGRRAMLQLDGPREAFLVKGDCTPKPGCAGSEAAPGLFMATTRKTAERQTKGKNKSDSYGLDRTSNETGTDLGAKLLFLTQTLHCAAGSLAPRTLVFELSADSWLRTGGRWMNVLRRHSLIHAGRRVSSNLPRQSRPGQRGDCAHKVPESRLQKVSGDPETSQKSIVDGKQEQGEKRSRRWHRPID